MTDAVSAHGLHKRYGETKALDGFSLDVPEGSVCGLLGPNGAGKTTAVKALTTLIRLDAGRATVAGYDVATQAAEVRYRIGLNSQEPALDEVLTGRDNLVMFGRLYHLGLKTARRRAAELLEQFGLADAADKPIKHYSGGMRRRLDLAASLIMAPAVLFLDEPTTGLDPRNRNEVWQALRELVRNGTTLVLTTQYLDEADQLADRIAVIDSGRVIASGTPEQLKSQVAGDHIEVVLRSGQYLAKAADLVARAALGVPAVDEVTRSITCAVSDRVAALTETVVVLADAGIDVEDIHLRRPTLDEVFLHLTGSKAVAA